MEFPKHSSDEMQDLALVTGVDEILAVLTWCSAHDEPWSL